MAILGIAATPTEAKAGDACTRTEFKSKLVADACKKGGQAEAKKVMKTFLRDAKKQDAKLTCQSCHTNLAPKYELKPDAVELFKKYGGK